MTGDKSNQPRNVTEGYNANAGKNLLPMEKNAGTNAGKNTPSNIQNSKSVPKPPPPKKN